MSLTYVVEIKDNGSASLKKMGDNAKLLEEKFKHVDTQVNIFNKSLGFLKTSFATALGSVITKGVGTLVDLGNEMVNSYDSANKLSKNIGIAADSVLGLRHAAELSGVGAEAMDKNLAKLSKTISDAASGSKQASDAFGKMGINVKNADGTVKNSEKVLMEMADAFKKLPDGAQKATLAMDVFGKSGASMVSMLKGGSSELQKLTNEGKAFAGNTEAVAEAMEKLKDASVRAKADLMGMIAALADTAPFKSMLGYLDELGKKLGEAAMHKKTMREIEAQDGKASLKLLELQKAQLQYSQLAEGEKVKHVVTTQKQIDVLKEKLKLDDDELKLMEAKASIAIGEKSQNRDFLADARLTGAKLEIKAIEDKRAAEAKAAADAAKAQADWEKNQKALADAEKAREEARKKSLQMYEAETKRLNDWLASYEKSKRTESDIAKDNYDEQLKNLEELNKRKIL
ncbi:MAG: phage tail tape measure protein, partial [Fibromonadales bacterium]|nr:phage tail tape measure protein [Fibromonadales bacterium]